MGDLVTRSTPLRGAHPAVDLMRRLSPLFVCLELHDTVIKRELCSLRNPFVLARWSGKCSSREGRALLRCETRGKVKFDIHSSSLLSSNNALLASFFLQAHFSITDRKLINRFGFITTSHVMFSWIYSRP